MKTHIETNSKIKIDPSIAGISRKTIEKIIKAWQESGNPPPIIRPDVPGEDKKRLFELMSDCIKEDGGDLSKQAKIIHLAMIYINLTETGKRRFLKMLAIKFDVKKGKLNKKIENLTKAETDMEKVKAELDLRNALIPPRVKFLKQLINLPNGFIFLKDMRRDILPMIKSLPILKKLSTDIKNLLITYFDINLLDMQEISWDSPASMLERLMKYEAVHEIQSWKDLKHRLFTDNRVFAFFHYKMPNDPLIFVEVSLVKGMADNIQKLLDWNATPIDPQNADTAIFYSISSTQKGLKGISFGNFLIKRVVKKLLSELPNIKTFATLSPIPGFINWLKNYAADAGNLLLKSDEISEIKNLSKKENPAEGILEILNIEDWYLNKDICEIIKRPLMRLCTHYLIYVKRNKSNNACDPVSNFHLSNGAIIEHLHWMADISKKGIKQSAGIMLNYLYNPKEIVTNHEEYMTSGRISVSTDALKWLK